MLFLGLDIGTTSLCCSIFDALDSAAVYVDRSPNKALLDNTQDSVFAHEQGHMQDPLRLLEQAEQLISRAKAWVKTRQTKQSGTEIGGIGIASQMHGIVYVDEKGQALSPLFTWLDHRSEETFTEHSHLEMIKQSLVERVSIEKYQRICPASGYGLATHFSLQQRGLVPANAVKLCSIGDFVAMRLSEKTTPVSDATLAHSLGFFDVLESSFCHESLAALHIDEQILPELCPSDSIVGEYEGIPLFTAVGDNQAAFQGSIGSICKLQQSALITLGTSGQISFYCNTPESSGASSGELRPYLDGKFLLVGSSLCAGKSYEILRNFFRAVGQWLTGETQEEQYIYGLMNQVDIFALSDIPKLEPFFYGSRQDAEQKASFSGFGHDNFTPEHLIASFVFGIVEELHTLFESFPRWEKIQSLVGSGSFLEKCPFVPGVIEKIFQRPLLPMPYAEPAALGAALQAMRGRLGDSAIEKLEPNFRV